tara:strand:- start:5462 stop:7006 length:1545 start_codon:yes stop_codon:yes gene_type:complete
MKRIFLTLLILLIIIGSCGKNLKKKHPPNIVLFFVDDMGWQDTSVNFWSQKTPFNEIYRTPNMERLAKKGVKFTNAYATPVCSPTRVSLMTGMNAARHRVTNWTLRPDQKQPMELDHPSLIFPDWNFNGLGLNPSTPNTVYAKPLPQLLSEKGYYTIHAGKAHFGAIGYPSSNPSKLGFDVNIAGHAAGAPGSYLGLENFGNGNPDREVWAVPGLEKYHGQDIFLTEALAQEVFFALDQPVEKKQPFFLYFSLYGIHTPLMANERYVKPYRKMGLEEPEARYASMIESMDDALGNLMDYLKENQLEKNTVILFMSDNGGLSAVARGGEKHTHNTPLKSGKGSIYEGGIRVPMLSYWPNQNKAETINHTPIIIEDFFPTILEIAEIDAYDVPQKIDGQSFVSLLQSRYEDEINRSLFWHYPNDWGNDGPGIGSFSAVRQGQWKLIYFHTNNDLELYNLKDDIRENENLLSSNYKKAKQLSIKLTQYLKKVNAQMPLDKLTNKVVPWPSNLELFKE